MQKVIIYAALFLLLASFASAVPVINSITVETGFERSLEIKFNASSDVNLTSYKLLRVTDNVTVASSPLSGTHLTDFYRDSDVNVVDTYTYRLTITDASGQSVDAEASAKLDIDAPTITSPLTISSNKKTLTVTTNEPAICAYGLTSNATKIISQSPKTEHVADIPELKEGQNAIYIICTDPYNNEFKSPLIIAFTYDGTKPSKPGIDAKEEAGSLKLTWSASTDASGIKEYRIYKSTESGSVFSSSPQTTTELSYTDNPQQTTFYGIGAVDNAGNEERSDVLEIKKGTQPAPVEQPQVQPAEEPKPADTEKKSGFRMAYLAWLVFIIIVIWILLRFRRQKQDKFGLNNYLHQRRKRFG